MPTAYKRKKRAVRVCLCRKSGPDWEGRRLFTAPRVCLFSSLMHARQTCKWPFKVSAIKCQTGEEITPSIRLERLERVQIYVLSRVYGNQSIPTCPNAALHMPVSTSCCRRPRPSPKTMPSSFTSRGAANFSLARSVRTAHQHTTCGVSCARSPTCRFRRGFGTLELLSCRRCL